MGIDDMSSKYRFDTYRKPNHNKKFNLGNVEAFISK